MYTDDAIVELFWERNEDSIDLLHKKHGKTLANISYRILHNESDVEECVNDTYMRTWTSIPEARPKSLIAYTGRIIRNLSINLLKRGTSQKRGADQIDVILSEIEDIVSSNESVESEIEYQELAKDISVFLKVQPERYRKYFMDRYWFAMSFKDIAKKHNDTEKKVELVLYRCRKKLKEYLVERGHSL